MGAPDVTGPAETPGGRTRAAGQGRHGAWGLVAVVLLVGVHLVRGGADELRAEGPPQPLAAAAPDAARAYAALAALPVPDPLPGSTPVRVRVPAVRIDAPVTEVGLDADGWIEAPPPEENRLAGWFTGAVTPGERGTAVIVGHVDTPGGRAVFYDLGALGKGHRVEVARRDGRTAVFAVYGVEVVPKEGFPAERVYADAGVPELRLITCGGTFTEENGYAGNVVVSARLVQVR
ncbi:MULTISPECIES: class F sortase [Streptomyces]|uniref:Putative secreted protein n=2 Tax=Streptomyces venezuelae TaxID=54571 RepID=F2REW5_STRVP|nr:class F sortase [Streptomyces venezuelae]APE25094.1 class F sortase [Streptomyces venezuelae]QES02437.1 class F sortase [Streptomyces venezuelae ATCC 10712]CCA59650.1 putative secreted protein [Streptomyces venezuelae ATCC 10712]